MNTDTIIAAILSGVALTVIIPAVQENTRENLPRALTWQQQTVFVAEEMGSRSAAASRQQIDAGSAVFNSKLDDLLSLEVDPANSQPVP